MSSFFLIFSILGLMIWFPATSGGLYLPLRSMVAHSKWLVLACYPILLIVGVIITLLTRSYSEEDLMVYRAVKSRLRAWRR